MMSWLTKVVNGVPDDYVHAKLMKYGIGEHPGPRAFLKISKARIAFKADLDTEKIFTRAYLEGCPDGSQKVKGLVMTYNDRRSELSNLTMPITWRVSKGKGATTYKAKLDEIAPLQDIKELYQIDGPTTFLLLSLNPRDGSKPWKIATKTSFPKGPKGGQEPGKKEKAPAFTKGALANTPEMLDLIVDELFPEVKDLVTPKTKTLQLRQTIVIDTIEVPDDPDMPFSEKRKLAKKKGKFIRKITIDETEHVKEFPFLA
ncbi:MAG: hypothetical protein ACTSU3_03680 [Candidatus Thorarchaeota archaeon]